MNTVTEHPLIVDYLDRLRVAAHRLPADERANLVADIEEHFAAAQSQGLHDESGIRNLLDRLGTPEALVDAISPPTVVPAVAPAKPREAQTIVAFVLAEVLAVTVLALPLGLAAWIIGLVLLGRCHRWTQRQTRLAGLVFGSGLPVAVVGVLAGSLSAFHAIGSCAGDASCVESSSGPAPWLPVLLGALLLAYVAPRSSSDDA